MKSPIRWRLCFAYIVLAFWIAVTLLMLGHWIVDEHADAMTVREAVFHAKPDSENIDQIKAETNALEKIIDYQKNFNLELKWEFRIWLGLTLLGAALFAEKSDAHQ